MKENPAELLKHFFLEIRDIRKERDPLALKVEFKLIVIYRGRFYTQESLLSKFLFVKFIITLFRLPSRKKLYPLYMVHVHHKNIL